MTNQQLYLAAGVPVVLNGVILVTILSFFWAHINTRFDSVHREIDQRFEAVNRRFDAVNQRFDDLKDAWFQALLRVEGTLDARLSHLEEKFK
jgi:nitrogen fixation-related uncharacterized protein